MSWVRSASRREANESWEVMSTVSAVERRHFPRRSSSDTSVALKTPGPSSLSWLSSRRVQKFRVRARQRSERHWENAVHGFFSESCGHTDTHGDTSAAYTNIYRRNNMKIFFFFFLLFPFLSNSLVSRIPRVTFCGRVSDIRTGPVTLSRV